VPICIGYPDKTFEQEFDYYRFEIMPMIYDEALQTNIIDACVGIGLQQAKNYNPNFAPTMILSLLLRTGFQSV
jgi:hypothetical protein